MSYFKKPEYLHKRRGPKNVVHSQDVIDRVLSLYSDGYNLNRIGIMVGLSRYHVKKIVTAAGILDTSAPVKTA